MRISNRIVKKVELAIKHSFGNVDVYLFGSRVDDKKTGGDIDLAVNTSLSKEEFKKAKTNFNLELIKIDFDYKIDLLQYPSSDILLNTEIKNASKLIITKEQ